MPLLLLVILFALKLVATAVTVGSGGSGGIFSPSLFLGAAMGGAYGLLLHLLIPGLVTTSPAAFALIGMAGVVAGSTGAALTSIVMVFEMTLDYDVILPMTVVVAVSYGIRKLLSNESIYTLKLIRRGHDVPESMQTDVFGIKRAKDLMDLHFRVIIPFN